jgi:hypothetical protein
MAFDGGGGGGFARQGSGVGGVARTTSARGAAVSYQNAGESAWAGVVSRVEDELRRFTALTAQLKKGVDAVGSARDSDDVRQKIATAIARGKDSVADISNLLKTKLADLAGAEDEGLSQKERTARRNQQQRFEKDWSSASTAYKDVRGAGGGKRRRRRSRPLTDSL